MESYLQDFLDLFNTKKFDILAFEGCQHLVLWQDSKDPRICFTCSYWETENHLEAYRQSLLFKETWRSTKKLFAEKPEAWTVKAIS